jgi:hypothetical protein
MDPGHEPRSCQECACLNRVCLCGPTKTHTHTVENSPTHCLSLCVCLLLMAGPPAFSVPTFILFLLVPPLPIIGLTPVDFLPSPCNFRYKQAETCIHPQLSPTCISYKDHIIHNKAVVLIFFNVVQATTKFDHSL